MNIENIIKKSNKKFIEHDLRPFLRIPSYTINLDGILQAKTYIINYIKDIISDIRIFEQGGNPLFIAKIQGNLENSLLIYSMYDTQPINNEEEWYSPPLAAEDKELPELKSLGKCLIARGAYNSKSPLIAFLSVIKILKEHDALPISLYIIFDGEEEIGSPTLINLIENNKIKLPLCKAAYYPAAKQSLNHNAVLKLGYKGILSFSLKINTLNRKTHSAYSSMIPNAAWLMIELLNQFYEKGEFKLKTLRFDQISKIDNEICAMLLPEINIKDFKKKVGINIMLKEDFKSAFIDYLFKPTFNISTFKSGFMGIGIQNSVPNSAFCNVDIRFAHEVTTAEIYKEIEETIRKFKINHSISIELKKNVGYEGSRINKGSLLVKSLIKSFKILGVDTEIWPLSAAAAPLSVIKKKISLDFLVGGLGIGGNAHAPNEYIQISSILNMRLSYYYFLNSYSEFLLK